MWFHRERRRTLFFYESRKFQAFFSPPFKETRWSPPLASMLSPTPKSPQPAPLPPLPGRPAFGVSPPFFFSPGIFPIQTRLGLCFFVKTALPLRILPCIFLPRGRRGRCFPLFRVAEFCEYTRRILNPPPGQPTRFFPFPRSLPLCADSIAKP